MNFSSTLLLATIGRSNITGLDWLMIALYFGILACVAWWVVRRGKDSAADRGKKVMTSQKYEVKNELASGDQVVLEVDWSGTLAVPFQNIPKGGQMRAHFAMFMRFKGGKIVAQRNYDCYEPS